LVGGYPISGENWFQANLRVPPYLFTAWLVGAAVVVVTGAVVGLAVVVVAAGALVVGAGFAVVVGAAVVVVTAGGVVVGVALVHAPSAKASMSNRNTGTSKARFCIETLLYLFMC
jgi:hypothetical protein